MSDMKFIADGMLGKVARWLRMLGYDTEYANDLHDEEILKIAMDEGRIILTKDYQLFRKANINGIKAVFVEGNTHVEKLADLIRQLNIRLEINMERSRCPRCNSAIRMVNKENIKDKVPVSTYKIYNEFWICTACGQIYWKGSHWKRINDSLNKARIILLERSN
ncbi:MAG: Mut7-C RNAse domain-containing protein [Candidatus Bathyarchaeia archaeon]